MTMNTERRKFIAGVGAAAASTAVLAGGQALAQGNQQIGAKAIPYQAKPMPFDAKSITGISEKVLVSHYENNYVGAVKRLNAIGTRLAEGHESRKRQAAEHPVETGLLIGAHG
jgi:superoxide dismutase, Fe-Mn family